MEANDERGEGGERPRSRVVLRVRGRAGDAAPARETAPLSPLAAGLCIGTASPDALYCNRDTQVDAAHGTLERTPRHGVWVFVDHSARGSTLNGRTRVHCDAVVVRSGDTLTVGETEIEIAIVQSGGSGPRKADAARHVATNAFNAGRRWSMPKQSIPPIDTTFARAAAGPPAFKRATSASAAPGAAAATTPEYINSPIPGNNWRHRRKSMVTTAVHGPLLAVDDARANAKAIPSPPVAATAHPFAYPRGRTLVSPASTATSSTSSVNSPSSPTTERDVNSYHRQHQLYIRTNAAGVAALRGFVPPPPLPSPPTASPIPLEYSSSPVSSPSPFSHFPNERQGLESKHPAADLTSRLGAYTGGIPDSGPPKSRRDDLRIQVSKKMAAAVAEGQGRDDAQRNRQNRARQSPATDTSARILQRNLEFTPPSSPVPQSHLDRQQKSLLAILKHKYKEEQLLKQQQEEWMRRQFEGSRTRSDGDGTPPLSPIRSSQTVHPTTPTSSLASPRYSDSDSEGEGEGNELSPTDMRALIPDRLPELLRTLSTGAQNHLPSPRVAQALLASRVARANIAKRMRRVQSGDLVHDGDEQDEVLTKSADTEDSDRLVHKGLIGRSRPRSSSTSSSDSVSVSSSVTTVPARHRRVTRSLSIGSSSDSEVSEPRSSPPSPLDMSCSESDMAVTDFFIGYGDDTDEEDDPAPFRFYPDDEFVSRSREDSAPLIGSAPSKASIADDAASSSSSSSSASSPPPSGLFPMDALRSPRRLTDHVSRQRPRRDRDYLLSKLRGPEVDQTNEEQEDAAKKIAAPATRSDNNRSYGVLHAGKSPPTSWGRRRRSAPPTTMTLGLPTAKLALSPVPPALQQEQNQQDDDAPELDEDDHKFEHASPPPPPPPPAEAPGRGAGPRRPSFRRRSAFALA